MIFQRSPGEANGFISVKFLLSTVIRKEFPLLGVRKHCINGKVLNINASVHLTSSYVNQIELAIKYKRCVVIYEHSSSHITCAKKSQYLGPVMTSSLTSIKNTITLSHINTSCSTRPPLLSSVPGIGFLHLS